jgi:putative ABC transport system permease protein
MWQNVRFGIRTLLKSPGITLLILVTLALGIGANTTVFSVINSVLVQPLPYPNPDRIVQVEDLLPANGSLITSSLPKYLFVRERAHSFEAFAAMSGGRFQIAGPAPALPAEMDGARVSATFFRVFGVKPAAGRVFLDNEDRPGAEPVAIISTALWRNRFGSDPAVIGRRFTVDGENTTIVGVMPGGFDFPDGARVWIPKIFAHPAITPLQVQRGASYLLFFARLANGSDTSTAQAEMSLLSRQYDESHQGFGDTGRSVSVTELRESIVGDVRLALMVLLGAAAFVLLIGAANIANLLLARAIARQKEIAVRTSLGATRSRLLMQLLTESVLLSGAGAVLGVLLSLFGVRFISQTAADLLPRASEIRIDATILLFTAIVAALTGVLFGLGPALHSVRTDVSEALKAAGRGSSSGGRLRGTLVVAEVALAMMLLAGAGLLLRSFLRLESVDPGFQPGNLYTLTIRLASARYPQRSEQANFWDRVLERASSVPGIQDAAIANALPVNGRAIGYFFNVEGRPVLEPSKAPTFWLSSISPGYFRTMGIRLLNGRPFTAADTAARPAVGIINRGMARRFWPGENPIGRHVTYARESITVEIVGVAEDVKVGELGDDTDYDQLYVPYDQRPFLTMSLITRGDARVAGEARSAILTVDPDQPVASIRSMNEVIARSISTPRLRTTLIGAFAFLALALALIGIAGVAAWSVSRRTNEIGIRVALGATPVSILAMIARESLVLIGAGEMIGLLGTFALTRFISTFLFGVTPWDPLTLTAVTALLLLVSLIACLFAARRAVRIDPVAALRLE